MLLNATIYSSCAIKTDSEEAPRCPAWFKPKKNSSEDCMCGDYIPPQVIKCDKSSNVTKISKLACATYDCMVFVGYILSLQFFEHGQRHISIYLSLYHQKFLN